ncbi:MAG: hypothetical protein MMC33_002757 [Icmadophila ericetorum]|nr:hypothetical protein [Icmadophila ericetorum]
MDGVFAGNYDKLRRPLFQFCGTFNGTDGQSGYDRLHKFQYEHRSYLSHIAKIPHKTYLYTVKTLLVGEADVWAKTTGEIILVLTKSDPTSSDVDKFAVLFTKRFPGSFPPGGRAEPSQSSPAPLSTPEENVLSFARIAFMTHIRDDRVRSDVKKAMDDGETALARLLAIAESIRRHRRYHPLDNVEAYSTALAWIRKHRMKGGNDGCCNATSSLDYAFCGKF